MRRRPMVITSQDALSRPKVQDFVYKSKWRSHN
jgi:hypothetical protein